MAARTVPWAIVSVCAVATLIIVALAAREPRVRIVAPNLDLMEQAAELEADNVRDVEAEGAVDLDEQGADEIDGEDGDEIDGEDGDEINGEDADSDSENGPSNQ